MKLSKNLKIYSIFLIWFVLLWIIFYFIFSSNSNYDNREEKCIWKNIKSFEYNIDTKECFTTEISACQKSTFSSIEECKKLNWIN